MDEVDSCILRLRKLKKGANKEKFIINTKTITNHSDHNAWGEHEVEVSDFLIFSCSFTMPCRVK